ncbi:MULTISPECIES: potassium/proton antiporter [Thalassospira]|jgi:cell volume regulation protein A|uniref:Potassium transporter n=1 Tax=Thalassospira xiamenensis TaxID=220697 RepID=A0ABR5Y7D9_9PROT|nr:MULTISPECIES: potassium/proton antiporter [Thalassospira]KZD06547.1 potassium transporter [Thalassospira xiamenensis]KZD10858.1 potassium transporter [Thalassospira xiamenensis]MAB33441.1 potassium/proton antiporter [Thalassospira sp.]MBA05450.1 potassium/proton antiporter [Thalassospira sp.]MCD1592763.1 potassium/proton antiporter [Thalassospira xiamenensis]|tara:strand:- start:8409 stop:10367 length:1959 start_codon:yes stop_codon:yes gene_type:complete
MIESMNLVILIASVLVVVAVFTSLISFRVGAPLLLVFLFVGLGAGEDGIGGINFDNAPLAYFIGSIALAMILFDSGFETQLRTLKIAAAPSLVLATVGVMLTAFVVGGVTWLVLDVPWLVALLFGAIVSSTDAAAVFFLLRVGGINLRDRTRSTLEVESGSNDPMAVFLTISLVELIMQGGGDNLALELLERFVLQIGLGAVLGLLGGMAIVQMINRVKLEPALVPIVTLACALSLFGATSIVGGSGFLAVYVAGLYAGNSQMRMSVGVRRFQHVTTWLAQIVMFVTMGLLATPSQFGDVIIPGVILALVLVFVARPVAVWLCLMFFNFSRNDTAFISWVGLRGAVSILLAIVPMVEGVEYGQLLFNTAFIVVITSLLLQGWTIRLMARWLGIMIPPRHGPVDRIDLELPGNANQEIVVYRVHSESAVATGQRIPRWARPSLILRDGKSLRPHSAGRIEGGDQVYIITPPRHVELLDQLFAGPAEGANDVDLFGDFSFPPDTRIADLGRLYGFVVGDADEEATVAEILERNLSGDIEPGDRVAYGMVELIVRRIDDTHEIVEVGMAVEQKPVKPKRHLPMFHSRTELLAIWKEWQRRRLREKMRKKRGDDVLDTDDAKEPGDDMSIVDDAANDGENDDIGPVRAESGKSDKS